MANAELTISMITREATRVLDNNLVFTKQVRREYDNMFAIAGAKIGNAINIRKPARFTGRLGDALQIEDYTETSVPLVLNTKRGVDVAFTTTELTLSLDDFSDRVIKPEVASVANAIDSDGLALALQVSNEVGTPGTVPNTALLYLQAGQRLDEEAAPRDMDRSAIVSPAMQATLVDALKGLFQQSDEIGRQYEEGTMGRALGFKFSMDQNVRTFKVGTQGGTPIVNGAGQSGNSIITSGWSNSTKVLNAGDVISFANVNAVNPQSRQSTGSVRQFVITADVTSSGAGAATLPIAGPGGLGIVVAGPFQTVDSTPANSAAITVQGATAVSSPRGLAFHKDAFVFGCADLMLPNGVDRAARVSDKQLGMSVRMIRDYDINLDRIPCRLDVLYGYAVVYPELAVRIAS